MLVFHSDQFTTEEDNVMRDFSFGIEDLASSLLHVYDRWRDIEAGITISSPSSGLKAEMEYTGHRGRPKYIIKQEQILLLRKLRFTWTKIAQMYGVSRRTMYNVRSDLGLVSSEFSGFSNISDNDLKIIIRQIKQEMPDLGQSMLRGVLESRGVHVPMIRIRDCLSEVDPINTALRWATPIQRRVYSDRHHNLIR